MKEQIVLFSRPDKTADKTDLTKQETKDYWLSVAKYPKNWTFYIFFLIQVSQS